MCGAECMHPVFENEPGCLCARPTIPMIKCQNINFIVQTTLVKMVTQHALIMLSWYQCFKNSALYTKLLVCTYGLKMLQVCSMCDGGFEYCNFHL